MKQDRIKSATRLAREAGNLTFSDPVAYVYNSLAYAWEPHAHYLNLWPEHARVFVMGMNPGPWGMAQTGVPFGEVGMVRDWVGISGRVGKPTREHPKRPVTGFACARSEVSGARLWGWLREHYGTSARCFSELVVHNYCPLLLLQATGANLPPERLTQAARMTLEQVCDRHLRILVASLSPAWLVGVGRYATQRLEKVFPDQQVVGILHPSPASPAANRDWAGTVTKTFEDAGIWKGKRVRKSCD